MRRARETQQDVQAEANRILVEHAQREHDARIAARAGELKATGDLLRQREAERRRRLALAQTAGTPDDPDERTAIAEEARTDDFDLDEGSTPQENQTP